MNIFFIPIVTYIILSKQRVVICWACIAYAWIAFIWYCIVGGDISSTEDHVFAEGLVENLTLEKQLIVLGLEEKSGYPDVAITLTKANIDIFGYKFSVMGQSDGIGV